MCRERWTSLDGPWQFAHDDADEGLTGRWFQTKTTEPFTRTIKVPYPPESPASGIGDRGMHPVVWYRRTVGHEALLGASEASGGSAAGAADGRRVLVHFG